MVVVVALAGLLALGHDRALARTVANGPVVHYQPPVDAPIIDAFRPPTTRYGPGNRGIDYGTAPLTPVRAAGDGDVTFAGQVGGTLHVTIRHADGLRTSYSFLAAVLVRSGQRVAQGDVIGWSTEVVHFGVRDPDDDYLDPTALFGAPGHAQLVPGGDDGTGAPAPSDERSALRAMVADRVGPLSRLLSATGTWVVNGSQDALERARFWTYLAAESTWLPHAARIATGLEQWRRDQATCTVATEPAPRPAGRRIIIEVGGIGSTSEQAAIDRVDTATLGYAPGDVIRLSYAGGRVPSPGREAWSPEASAQGDAGGRGDLVSRYDAEDSQQDLVVSADRLVALLRATAAAHPGVPIDVVGHSQGGVVARLGVEQAAESGALPDEVSTLVTLGSPHQGADPAAVVQAGQSAPAGTAVEVGAQHALGLELDPLLPAARQLVPGSRLTDGNDGHTWPRQVRFTSVGARGDLVVPTPRTTAEGARHAVVPLTGVDAHDRLPGSPEATREIGLAVAGRGPTCRGLTQAATDLVTGEQIAQIEARLALATAGIVGGPPGPGP